MKSQVDMHSMEIVAGHGYSPGRFFAVSTVNSLAAKKPDYIFFFGSGDDFTAFAREMDRSKLEAVLISSAVMIGGAAFDLPPGVAARTLLAYPGSLPERDDFSEFISTMRRAGVSLRSSAFQAVAFAAAKIFVEATKSSGKDLSRAALINSLEQLQSFRRARCCR